MSLPAVRRTAENQIQVVAPGAEPITLDAHEANQLASLLMSEAMQATIYSHLTPRPPE